MISRIGFSKTNLTIGGREINNSDYICVITWDPEFELTRYHYAHKSVKDPDGYVKNLNPNELIFNSRGRNGRI